MSPTAKDGALDVGSLGLLVGMRFSQRVEEQLRGTDHGRLRASQRVVLEHLSMGPRTISELADLLDVTQQAGSKVVTELEQMAYVARRSDPADARLRRIHLTDAAWDAIRLGRELRAEIESALREKHGDRVVDSARKVLSDLLATLGGA